MVKSSLDKYRTMFRHKYGNRYTPLNYDGDKKPIDIQCNTCEKIISKPCAGNLIYSRYQPYICKSCDIIYRQKVQFERRKHEILDDSFVFLDEYKGRKIRIRVYHDKCENISLVNPDTFLDNYKRNKFQYCYFCNPSSMKDTKSFGNSLNEKSQGRLSLVGEYKSAKELISFLCNGCGTITTAMADNVIRRLACPVCDNKGGKHRQKTYKQLIETFNNNKYSDEYFLEGKYDINERASVSDRISITHKNCRRNKAISPYALPNYYCSECEIESWRKKEYSLLEQGIKAVTDGEYELVGGIYENNLSKMHIKHVSCNRIFFMSKNAFLTAGHRCSHCRASKGEQTIIKILTGHEYKFLHNKKLNDCKDPVSGKSLEMDFQILDEDGNLYALIEYDGKQHFEYSTYFGSDNPESDWKVTVMRDNARNQYSVINNIPLLRIPYIYTSYEEIEQLISIFLECFIIPNEIERYYSKYNFSVYG